MDPQTVLIINGDKFSMHVSRSVNGVHGKSAGRVQLFHSMFLLPPRDQLFSPREGRFVPRQLPCLTVFCMYGFAVTDERKTSVAVRPCLV